MALSYFQILKIYSRRHFFSFHFLGVHLHMVTYAKIGNIPIIGTVQLKHNKTDNKARGRHKSSLKIPQTHTTVLLLFCNKSGSTRVSRYQKVKTRKVKTNLDLLEQEIVSGSGICWAICKSAPHSRQPCQHPTTQFFTGRMPLLPPNQQRQSTEGNDPTTP